MSLVRTYRDLFRRNPALGRLLAGEFISGIGDWLYLVAILVVVYAESNSPVLLGVIGALTFLGMAAGPFLGPIGQTPNSPPPPGEPLCAGKRERGVGG